MAVARYIVGDALSVVNGLDDGSIDCVLTSPPYFTLRSYLPADHPDKRAEVGQEGSPGEFLEALLSLMDALWPKLADDGTFWVNLGDTHAGSGGAGGDYNEGGLREGQPKFPGTSRLASERKETKPRSPGVEKKARGQLAYNKAGNGGGPLRDRAVDEALGITPRRLRTRRTLPGYPVDQSVCFVPHLFGASLAYGRNLLTGDEHRQWVVRPPVTWCKPSVTPGREGRKFRTATELILYGGKHQQHYFDLDSVRVDAKYGQVLKGRMEHRIEGVPGRKNQNVNPATSDGRINAHELGAPPFNWWLVNTVPYAGAHFATFPPELCIRPIVAGCPEGGTVLDPFAGSGTSLAVAIGHGRNAVGIDIDERNADLARDRVGIFLEVEHAKEVA